MKRSKKVISLAACVAIVLTTATASVFAEDTTPLPITYPAADIQSIETPKQNPFVILIDGEATELESYSVHGSTYVRLSDMSSALGFAKDASLSDATFTTTAIELETKTEDGISYYSTDGGETWNEIKVGEFSLSEDGVVEGAEGFRISAITSPIGSGFSVSDTTLTTTAIELEIKTGDSITNLQESGKVCFFTASPQMRQYLINGEVFSNLRDLGKVLGYEVDFKNGTIIITK